MKKQYSFSKAIIYLALFGCLFGVSNIALARKFSVSSGGGPGGPTLTPKSVVQAAPPIQQVPNTPINPVQTP